jgi:Gpi18-like mannosyltransferase
MLSFFLHPDPARIHSNALTENLSAPGSWYYALLGIWERFDTLWYLHIAQHDYDLPRAVIFYPLYPAAIRLVSWALPATMAALLVSTVGAFFFFWGLLRLGREQLSVTGRLRMVLLVCVWPTSFVLFAGYAESLTLALIVWAVVFARSARWLPATACGVLAGLGRPTGVLVAIPLALLALRSRRLSAAVVLLTPAGLLSYWGWLRYSGRPSVVEAYRIYQGSTLAPPWASVWETLRLILQMLMYTGRPLLGAARYLLPVYPAFVVLGGWAAMRSGKQFAIYLTAFGFVNLLWMWAFLNWDVRFV